MRMKIEEILWEVTNRCNRNCSFCGSKEIMNKGEDSSIEDKHSIAEQIGRNTDKVTISGGEPLILEDEVLSCIVEILRSHDTKVSVVTNGDKLTEFHVDLFDAVGVSINAASDIEALETFFFELPAELRKKVVLITNVNKINYFDLDSIINQACIHELTIQFQLTMYKGKDPAMLDGEAINELRRKIVDLCGESEVRFIFADNLQEHHTCQAGIQSCGILYDGNVVPCLSERSWTDMRIQGNCLDIDLAQIWQDSFKPCRFGENFVCCRDCFNYVEPISRNKVQEINLEDLFKGRGNLDEYVKLYGVTIPNDSGHPPFPHEPQVIMYGINDPNGPSRYTSQSIIKRNPDESC